MKLAITFLSLVLLVGRVVALTAAQWRTQSIYQVLTDRFSRTDNSVSASCNINNYCGGSWQGIINKLDYIQNMGFTAIWISPVVENLPQSTSDGEAYHGYWAQNIYEINTNFGTASDLKALSAALHARGMYLMVDIVTNHLGYAGCGTCVDYSVFYPFNSQSYFHPYCPIDYNNQTSVEYCWEGDNTVALADLRTENSNVLNMWETWITQLVANYTIDGLRIDSSAEVDQAFFPPFVNAAGVYAVGEVDNGNPTYVCPYQKYLPGVLNYPAYYWITQAFESTSGSISNLVNGVNTMKSNCTDTTLLGSFMENHDNPRFPSYTSDISLAKNAIAFTMLADGIPIVYYGQEQHFSGGAVPNDREALWLSGYPTTSAPLYTFIAQLNKLRSRAISQSSSYVTTQAVVGYSDTSTIVMRKGVTNSQIVGVFSNKGANGNSYTLTLSSAATGFAANQAVLEVLGCTSYTTDSNGNLAVAMAGGLPRVFYPSALVSGSGICGSSSSSSTSTSTTATPTTLTTSTTTKTSSSSSSTTSSPSCTASTIPVTFSVTKTTTYGQTIYITGNTTTLHNWSTSSGIALSAANYTNTNHVWFTTVNLMSGAGVQYKYYLTESNGAVTWEGGNNRVLAVGCQAGGMTESDVWQS